MSNELLAEGYLLKEEFCRKFDYDLNKMFKFAMEEQRKNPEAYANPDNLMNETEQIAQK